MLALADFILGSFRDFILKLSKLLLCAFSLLKYIISFDYVRRSNSPLSLRILCT